MKTYKTFILTCNGVFSIKDFDSARDAEKYAIIESSQIIKNKTFNADDVADMYHTTEKCTDENVLEVNSEIINIESLR